MLIEVNPKSLQNLDQICEILYKLHPSVLEYMNYNLIEDIGCILGCNDGKNLSFEQREKLTSFIVEEDKEDKEVEEEKEECSFKEMINIMHGDGDYSEDLFVFNRLLKYLQLDTYEYIPIKIYIDVEDPLIRKKVRKLISFLEKTNAPEQFYLHKREEDTYAYFAEGYGLTMNEEQKKKMEDLYSKKDPEKLKKLLIKEKLYYY